MESTSEGREEAKEHKVSHAVSQQTEEKLHQVFDSLDANHNGRLEVPELKVRRPWSTIRSLNRILLCDCTPLKCQRRKTKVGLVCCRKQ